MTTGNLLSYFYDHRSDTLYLSVDAQLPEDDGSAGSLQWSVKEDGFGAWGLIIRDLQRHWRQRLPQLSRTVAAGLTIHLRDAHEVLKKHLW